MSSLCLYEEAWVPFVKVRHLHMAPFQETVLLNMHPKKAVKVMSSLCAALSLPPLFRCHLPTGWGWKRMVCMHVKAQVPCVMVMSRISPVHGWIQAQGFWVNARSQY